MKFSPKIALALGVVLAAAEILNLNISMSLQAHDALTLVVTILSGLGVLVATPSQIFAIVPHQVLVAITVLIGALQVVQTSSFHVSLLLHSIIAAVLIVMNTLFTSAGFPASPSPAQPPAAQTPATGGKA